MTSKFYTNVAKWLKVKIRMFWGISLRSYRENLVEGPFPPSWIRLSKQQAVDAGPKAIQQINFTGNLDRAGNTTIFFIIEEAKETILYFLQGTVREL